MHPQND